MDLKTVSRTIFGPGIFQTQVANLPKKKFLRDLCLLCACWPKPPVVGHKNLAVSSLVGNFRVTIYANVRKLALLRKGYICLESGLTFDTNKVLEMGHKICYKA